ncbi:MAG: InlB B-repeat-containing protein, partial [Treponema sp.]|nr:InlB B-repeat-containing protein [Treponema sp.]
MRIALKFIGIVAALAAVGLLAGCDNDADAWAEKAVEYTVAFHINVPDAEVIPIPPERVKKGETITTKDPTLEGRIFESWHTSKDLADESRFKKDRPITGDMELWARWQDPVGWRVIPEGNPTSKIRLLFDSPIDLVGDSITLEPADGVQKGRLTRASQTEYSLEISGQTVTEITLTIAGVPGLEADSKNASISTTPPPPPPPPPPPAQNFVNLSREKTQRGGFRGPPAPGGKN